MPTTVTGRIVATAGLASTANRVRSGTGGFPGSDGSSRSSHTATSTHNPATIPSAARQFSHCTATFPSGTPSAVATVNPPTTIANARARNGGRTSAALTAPAFGVYTAAPSAATTRPPNRNPIPGATADPRFAAASTSNAATSNARRGTRAVTVASTGAATAYATANTVIDSPAVAVDTDNDSAISGRN